MIHRVNQGQIPLSMEMREEATFENFYPGKNQAIVAFLMNALNNYDPLMLYLWGESDIGKTHLLQACCHLAEKKGRRAFYLPLNLIEQISVNVLTNLENMDLLCVDDIQVISTKPNWQEEFFYLYNRLQSRNVQLIVAAKQPQKELNFALKDLDSRLRSLVSFELLPLEDATKAQLLQQRAVARGFELSSEVVEFILSRYSRSLTDLLSALDKLDMASLSAQRKLTVPFVKQVLNI